MGKSPNKLKNASLPRGESRSRSPKKLAGELFHLPPTVSKKELLDQDGTSDREFRQLLYDLSALGINLNSARTYLASLMGISSPQYHILMILAQGQGTEGMNGSEVAWRLHVTTAFITSEITKLERAGIVEKRPDPKDGRGVLLRLTAAGEAKVQEIAPQRLWVNDHLFGGLSGEDFRYFAKIVASLVDDFTQTVHTLEVMSRSHERRSYAPRRGV